LQLDLKSQPFQSAHEMLLDHLPVMFIEVGASQVLIGPTVTQQVIHNDQDAMADGDGRAALRRYWAAR
jgi:hypothetical protein